MIESHLKHHLEPVAQRHRQLKLWIGLGVCWLAIALVATLFLAAHRFAGWTAPGIIAGLIIGAAVASFIVLRRSQRWEPDFREVARKIEQGHPDLHALLLTAVEQQPDPQSGQLNFLQDRVIREAVEHCKKHEWIRTVSARELNWARAGSMAALVLLALALLGLRTVPSAPMTWASKAPSRKVTVTPGDTKVERGSGLVVLARFTGPLPPEATLVIGAGTNNLRRIALNKTLNDPVFGGSIPEVNSNLVYRIEFGDEQTPEYKVTVFEHPRMERADAKISFPEYTGLSEKKIEDTRRISAVEGARLELDLKLNKPVSSATLVAKDNSKLPLKVDPEKPKAVLEGLTLENSKTYELQLVDTEGRTNKVPAHFVVEVMKNRAPEIKVASPRGDQRVSPIQEMGFQGEVWDDFGVKAYGVTYSIPGKESKSIKLGETTSAGEKRPYNHLLALESEALQPDQLISWYMWADDVAPDGKSRRTSSDMYFAEVRPFEEIFREGQSPAGGESEKQGGQNEASKAAESQKQIINATWKLQRQETAKSPSDQYLKDEPVVMDGQAQLLEKAEMLKEKAQDPRSAALIENVEKEMQKALAQLTKATNSTKPLPDALAAEQAAYQALLKLSNHEFQVAKAKNQKGKNGSSGAPNQKELEQLDLKQSEDRYETQSQASAQPTEQREQLQVQNRLKELAQRQQDLNEKLKELQNALQEAKTEQEKEEIRRQLKRLREQEQEMLADVDELRQRMDKPENQSKLADAKRQLEKSRSDIQRASEALDKDQASQALSAGTRAQRELQDIRDDLRKKNSSQFSEEMKQMRSEARQLANKQEEIGNKIGELKDNKQKKLSDSDQQKDLASQLAQQKSSLTNLLDKMRDVSEKAETAEPLLSKQLYDNLRKTAQSNTEKSLDLSEELMKRSLAAEAGRFEQKARQDINELKQGVERAAESVLGDDTEALRLAKRELDQLADQIERDIARAGRDGMLAGSNQKTNALQALRDNSQSNQKGQQGAQGQKGQAGEQGQQGEQAQQGKDGEQAQQGQQGKDGEQQGQQGQKGQGKQGENGQKDGEQAKEGQQGKDGEQGQQGQQGQGQQGKQGQKGEGQQGQQGEQGQKDQQQGEQGQQGQQGEQGKGQQGKDGQQRKEGQQGKDGQQSEQQGQGKGQPQSDPKGKGQGQGQGQGKPQDGQAQNGQQQQGEQAQQGEQGQQAQQNQQQAQAQGKGQGKAQQPGIDPPTDQRADQRLDGPASARGQGSNKPSNTPFWEQGASSRNRKDREGGEGGVLTGDNFTPWSDRMRDVEEMLDDPALRNEVSKVREKARTMRSDFKKNGKPPQWPIVKSEIAAPLAEVRSRINEELARRQSNDALVPIDRDPVPNKYSELVRRYYEKLGSAE